MIRPRVTALVAALAITLVLPSTAAWAGKPGHSTPVVTVLNSTALGGLGSGSTIGPDGALYVTNGNVVERIVGSAPWTSICSGTPSVGFVRPAEAATGLRPNALIIVAFNKAMDKAASQAAFSLKRTSDGAPVSGQFGWYGPGVLLFKPDAALAAGTQYTASVSAAAKELAGFALATAKTWQFTTVNLPVLPGVN